jgi:hypothetical protein
MSLNLHKNRFKMQFENTVEIGNNECRGAPFGEIETESRNLRI